MPEKDYLCMGFLSLNPGKRRLDLIGSSHYAQVIKLDETSPALTLPTEQAGEKVCDSLFPTFRVLLPPGRCSVTVQIPLPNSWPS